MIGDGIVVTCIYCHHLKFINPFFWLDGTALFGTYINLNFFGRPVSALMLTPVVSDELPADARPAAPTLEDLYIYTFEEIGEG